MSDFNKLIKKYRRKPLIESRAKTIHEVDIGKEKICQIIPNRDPFLFLHHIHGIDLENQCLLGSSLINERDPVFDGHFPGYPVYPGVLQLEMISELFCCLYYFVSKKTFEVSKTGPVNLRGIRMHDAVLQHAVLPGDCPKIITKMLDYNDLTFTAIGQLITHKKIAAVVIGEFYIVDSVGKRKISIDC